MKTGKTNRIVLIFITMVAFQQMACHSRSGQQTYALLSENVAGEESTQGKVTGIIDGDTYDLLTPENQTMRIRMEGIDAPEKAMPYYQVAKKYLSSMCFGRNVKIRITGRDRNGRILAFTWLEDGRELSHEMIRAGLAWHFKKYNSDSDLADLEAEAARQKCGFWQENHPVAPWEVRKLNQSGVTTKEALRMLQEDSAQ